MDRTFKNRLYTPNNGARVARVVLKSGEYFDIVIEGGTSDRQRYGLARYAHVLSGYYKYGDAETIKWDYIIMGAYYNGEIGMQNGEKVFGHGGTRKIKTPTTEHKEVFNGDNESIGYMDFITESWFDWHHLDQDTFEILSTEKFYCKRLIENNKK